MTAQAAPSPLAPFLPSINTVIVTACTALITLASTLATQKWVLPPKAAPIVIPAADPATSKMPTLALEKQIRAAADDIERRVNDAVGSAAVCNEKIDALRADLSKPVRYKAKPASTK